MIVNAINKLNVGVIGIVTILGVSAFMIAGAQTTSAVSLKGNPKNAITWMDDNCYSTLSVGSTIARNTLGPFSGFGLVNAVVRIPIYDWDQTPPSTPPGTLNGLPTDSHTIRFEEPPVKPIGYVERFSGTVTPLPNIRWAEEYVTKGQAQYDLGVLGGLIGIQNPHRLPNPAIANPLLYQRSSVYLPNGLPNFANINPHYKGSTPGESEEDIIRDSIGGANEYGDIIKDNVTKDQIDALTGGGYNVDNLKNTQGQQFGLFGAPFSVDARNNPSDNCYEYLNTDAKKVPAYAFSVPSFGLPFTVPGTVFTPVLWIMGELSFPNISFSGVTVYPPSANGKMMLDCYGRGITKTIVPGKRIGSYPLLQIIPPHPPYVYIIHGIALAADIALAGGNVFAPEVVRRLPMPLPSEENYYNGMAYLFTMDPIRRSDLPAELRGRDIEVYKNVSVNTSVLAHRDMRKKDNGGHEASNNGSAYYPNLYIKLKKPYNYQPKFSETEPSKTTPDGSDFTVVPEIDKYGYKKDPYDTGSTVPRTNRDPAPKGWAKARIIETVVKPGFSGNPPREREYLGKHLPGDGADLGAEAICDFIKTEIGNSPDNDAVESCNQHGGDVPLDETTSENFIKNEVNKVTLTDYAISRKIPAETPPGTKFCYSIYINQKENDFKYEGADYYKPGRPGYNPGYHAERDKRYLSKMYCVISGYKPSLQVRGGDMIVQGDVNTATNLKDDLGSGDPPTEKRTFGSWAEYGLFAGGSIDGGRTGSGAKYRVGQGNPASAFDPHGYLTFSNAYTSGNTPNYGTFSDELSDGFDRVTGFFNERSENAKESDTTCIKPGNKIKLSDCASGDYVINGDVEIEGGDIENHKNKSLVFFVEDKIKVSIKGDIKMPNDYDSSSEISQVVFTPKNAGDKYLIDIHQNVTRVDAWLLNPDGAINTCYNPKPVGADGNELGTPADDIPRAKDGQQPNVCYTNRLTVNGPVNAKHLILRRSGGVDQNQQPPYSPTHQSVPGEAFNLRPDAYLWAVNQVSSGGSKFMTVQTKDLPPRY